MVQTAKPKVLDSGESVKRLNTRQIKSICSRHGWVCQMERVPANEIQVDRRIVCDPRYRKSNAVMVAKSADGTIWQCLGWRWNIETLNEAQIVELLKALEATEKAQQLSARFQEWREGDEQEQRETFQALVDAGVIDQEQEPQ